MKKNILFFGALVGALLLVSCSGGNKKQAASSVSSEELDNASKVINYYHTSLIVLRHVANAKDINAVLGYMEQTGKVPEVSPIAPPKVSAKDTAELMDPGDYFNIEVRQNLKQSYRGLFSARAQFYDNFNKFLSYKQAKETAKIGKLLDENYRLSVEMSEYKQVIFDILSPLTEQAEKELLADLAATLRPERYLHTLGVAYTAANLAACFMEGEEEVKKARKAGLLHDCAKYLTANEMLNLCDKYGVILTQCERENPALVHGKLGAYLAKQRYGMKDEICSAIACHTTGKPKMTTLEKILYVADFIEPGRKLDCKPYSLPEVRKQSFRDLERGLFMTLENTVNYLQRTNIPIDELTFQTYSYYKDKTNNKK